MPVCHLDLILPVLRAIGHGEPETGGRKIGRMWTGHVFSPDFAKTTSFQHRLTVRCHRPAHQSHLSLRVKYLPIEKGSTASVELDGSQRTAQTPHRPSAPSLLSKSDKRAETSTSI